MASNNIKILFWIQPSKTNKKEEAPLYLRLTHQGIRKNMATGFKIHPRLWDSLKGRVKGTNSHANNINAQLQHIRERLMTIFNQLLRDGNANLDKLLDCYRDKDKEVVSLLQLVMLHNKDFQSKIGVVYRYSTYEKYEILLKKLQLFIPYKYGKEDFGLKNLSCQFIEDFDFYLRVHDHNQHNTAIKYLKNLKKIINIGVMKGWVSESPFINYRAVYKEVDRIYLTAAELQAIESKKLNVPRLLITRDVFLFQCYTGLAYSDLARLKQKDIVEGINNKKWIIIRRQKTDIRSAIPLLPQALNLLQRNNKVYRGCGTEWPLFQFYAIQKYNVYLHELADVCDIQKRLTSHVGRRTFATTVAMGNGMGLETISKILGHTNTKITAQYAVVTDYKVAEEMQLLEIRLRKKSV
jgi:integrase